MGVSNFYTVQYGKETTRGTAVAATKKWLGMANVPADRTPIYTKYKNNLRIDASAGLIPQIFADGITLDLSGDRPGYYQALPLLFSIGLKGNITATEVTTAQSDYLWTFDPSITSTLNAPDAITLEVGDENQVFEIEYLMAKSIRIGGKIGSNGFVDCSAECFGRQVTPATLTGALTVPTVEPILANNVRIYLDPTWATLGTTEITGHLSDFSWQMETGVQARWRGNSKLFASHYETGLAMKLNLTAEADAQSDLYYDYFQAQTAKAIRISISGSTIGSGTAYNLTIDQWVVPEQAIPLANEDAGLDMSTVVLRNLYNTTASKSFLVKVTSNANTI
jgi:hypothetical protein